MLDAKLVVEDVEELLDKHYAQLSARGVKQLQPRVQVYNAPAQPPQNYLPANSAMGKQPQARSVAAPLNELVANLFVLFMLSVVSQRLSNQSLR